MTIKTLTAVVAFFLFISCKSNSRQDRPVNDTPQALTNTTTSYDIIKKRGYEDLIERLYSELLTKEPGLKNIEEKIDSLRISGNDSMQSFFQFDHKNQSYYNSANTHTTHIKDSVLREKIRFLITASLLGYKTKISAHTLLVDKVNANDSTIADLHLALKIIKTMPLI